MPFDTSNVTCDVIFLGVNVVGNIPHEVADGNLRELLLEYGLILNFRLFKDVLSQYAFCEYEEPEMAVRAMHCLNNYAIKGQALRVDIATSNRSAEEMASLQEFVSAGTPDLPQPMDVSEKAPEEISKAVASLPAEQMFELMKQMKMCIENNPQEARNLLLQNPQLAYALLQAQVIMRIVDPEVALQILDRPAPDTAEPEAKSVDVKQTLPAVSIAASFVSEADKDMRQLPQPDYDMRSAAPASADKDMRQVSGDVDLRTLAATGSADTRPFDPRFRPADPRAMQGTDPRSTQNVDPRSTQNVDPRSIQGADPRTTQGGDPRSMQAIDPRAIQRSDPRGIQVADPRAMQDADLRVIQGGDPRTLQGADPRMMQGGDPRMMQGPDPRSVLGGDPRAGMQGPDPRSMLGGDPRAGMHGSDPRGGPGIDPRAMQGVDPRTMQGGDPRAGMGNPGQQVPGFGPRPADPRGGYDPRSIAREDPRKPPNVRPPVSAASEPAIPEDEEKAALIMQVLQLSEEQISMLPPEQRQSIMVLKEQIARSQLL